MRAIAILVSAISLFVAFQVHAQAQCSDLFRPLSQESTLHSSLIHKALSDGKQIFSSEESNKETLLVIGLGAEKIVLGPMNELAPQTEVYHWGNEQEHASLTSVGALDQASIISRINGRDRAGGGFYVSLSPIDSASFGPQLTVSTFQKPVLEVPRLTYRKILEFTGLEDMSVENMDVIAKLRSAVNIDLIHAGIGAIEINPTWKVLLNETSLANIRTPTADQVRAAIQRQPPANARAVQLFIDHEVPNYLKPVQDWIKSKSDLK